MVLALSMPARAQPPQKKGVQGSQSVEMRLWVSAYFYPNGPGLREWNRLIVAAKVVPIVAIVNPASGPGDQVDKHFAAVLHRKAGITIVGYISTQYTRKNVVAAQREVDRFFKFYPDLQGFHFDEQSSDARGVDYYVELYHYVHNRMQVGSF